MVRWGMLCDPVLHEAQGDISAREGAGIRPCGSVQAELARTTTLFNKDCLLNSFICEQRVRNS